MKRLLFSALLAGSLMLPLAGTQAAEPAEYVMCGGDQLQLTVYNHPDLSSPLNVPLITNARLASAFINAFCTMTINDIAIKSWSEY